MLFIQTHMNSVHIGYSYGLCVVAHLDVHNHMHAVAQPRVGLVGTRPSQMFAACALPLRLKRLKCSNRTVKQALNRPSCALPTINSLPMPMHVCSDIAIYTRIYVVIQLQISYNTMQHLHARSYIVTCMIQQLTNDIKHYIISYQNNTNSNQRSMLISKIHRCCIICICTSKITFSMVQFTQL